MIIQITRRTWRVAGIILAIALAGLIYLYPQVLDPIFSKKEAAEDPAESEEEVSEPLKSVPEEVSVEEESTLYAVHVSGAVKNPDQIWYLPEGSRVGDAVEAAGGATKKADLARLNLAERVYDGQKIYVPRKGEFTESTASLADKAPAQTSPGLININTASREELMELSGIGGVYADRILQYRKDHGPFSSIEEICNVQGIGEKTFKKFKDQICV